ncbi:MAG: hypothetical protein E4H01_00060 [Lysobacterales bacterium]|nr:MAG: hypothetical protein E4H01_00060 [Xanthomonadales bacterium]
MSARFQFYQSYGTSPGTDVPQGTGASSNDWDFKSVDTPGPIAAGDVGSQGIRAGDFSMHVYVRAKLDQPTDGSSTFSSIDNVKFYASDLNLSGCGDLAYVLASGTPSYTQPALTSKSGVWSPVPTVAGSGIDIGTAGLVAGTAGFTNWVGLQLKTSISGASAGYSGYSSFTVVYDEV